MAHSNDEPKIELLTKGAVFKRIQRQSEYLVKMLTLHYVSLCRGEIMTQPLVFKIPWCRN